MSWVTIIWSMNAAVCLTLAGIYLIVWLKARRAWGHLLFACSAVGTAAIAACELLAMRAETVEGYGTVVRWAHVPLWVLVVSIVWFTRFHLRAGRPWLAWAATGMRTLALALNFLATPNINFQVLTGLRHIPFLGESISIPQGTVHPWAIVAKLSSVLLMAFLVNAALEIWRRGERRQALLLGGSMIFFITAAAVHTVVVERGLLQSPYLISFAYLGTILVMAYELSRDVLRAAQLSDELRESEERMTLAAEAAGFGVWIWSIDRNQVWASEKWLRLFGFAPDAAVNFENVIQRIHPDDREPVKRAVQRAMEDGGDYVGEFRVVLPDGTQRWISARGRAYADTNGKPARMLGVSLDITEAKRAAAETQGLRLQLWHADRVAQTGAITASLAHELNQPLTGILSTAQAGLRFTASGNADCALIRELLSNIVHDTKRAGAVINGLRAMLRRKETRREPIDLAATIQEVLELVHSELIGRQVQASQNLEPDLTVVADKGQIQQVLLNLLMNALEAMQDQPDEARHLKLALTRTENGEALVSLRDSGPGVPEGGQEKLFEAFWTTKKEGMGIGLAVSRSIIEFHGGRLWFANNPDRGATFYFSLPVRDKGRGARGEARGGGE